MQKIKENFSTEEETLKKQKARREIDIDTITKKFESDLKRLNSERAEHEEKYHMEFAQVEKLRDHFAKADAEAGRIASENALNDIRNKKLNQKQQILETAANAVQGFWRGILQREEYAKILKASKKKGKKSAAKKKE